MTTDRAAAEENARNIIRYWKERGHDVEVEVVEVRARRGLAVWSAQIRTTIAVPKAPPRKAPLPPALSLIFSKPDAKINSVWGIRP
jgi:hypothetical protein